MHPPRRLKEMIQARAAALGLDAVAIADARPFDAEREALLVRRDLGLESPLEPSDLEGRCRPERWLPGARTVLTAALSYHAPHPRPREGERGGPPRGVVARYAWGEDYHRVLKEKLARLAEWIAAAVPGAACAVLVDTGPPVERAAAARSGLGWIGKNCCLITPAAGSWVSLGEIVTTVPLDPDPPFPGGTAGGCGDCDRCLRACPTGALVAPGVLDHRRCLSYASQMKGTIPRALRAALGRRVWGCDTCQEACPRNRVATQGRGGVPQGAGGDGPPAYERARPRLTDLAEMAKGEFRRAFERTAAGWRGRHTLRRNALVALGNARDPATLPVLVRALGDPRPEIRLHAAWALGRFAGTAAPGAGPRAQARLALERARPGEPDPDVRAEMEAALG